MSYIIDTAQTGREYVANMASGTSSRDCNIRPNAFHCTANDGLKFQLICRLYSLNFRSILDEFARADKEVGCPSSAGDSWEHLSKIRPYDWEYVKSNQAIKVTCDDTCGKWVYANPNNYLAGKWYKISVLEMTFDDAKEFCEKENSVLAMPRTADEANRIKDLFDCEYCEIRSFVNRVVQTYNESQIMPHVWASQKQQPEFRT